MDSTKAFILFLTVILIQSTIWSNPAVQKFIFRNSILFTNNSILTRSPKVQIGIIDFTHNDYDSLTNRYTLGSIPEYTLYFYLRPVATTGYSFARETSLLKYRLLHKYSIANNSYLKNFSIKDSAGFWQNLALNGSYDSSSIGIRRFRENMKYNIYSYAHSLDTFQLDHPKKKSIETLMKEFSEYRNNVHLYTIEKHDLRNFYYDTVNLQYRPDLMTYQGSVVGLSMLSSASKDLNFQIHDQMQNKGNYRWKDIHWGKVIASGVAGGLTSAYVMKVEKRGKLAGTNSFGGRAVRKLVTNTIETGVQSIGLFYDSRQHGFDYTQAQKSAFLNRFFKMGSSGMNAVVNRYIFRSTWDPWFEHFSRQIHGFDLHKDIHNKFNRDIQFKKPFDPQQSSPALSGFRDTVSVIPIIDFGWPIIYMEEEEQKDFFVPSKKENSFLE